MRDDLQALMIPLSETSASGAALEVVCVMTRVPVPAAEIERLRALARTRPLALVGLQNDAFLDQVPEAALRISAADATPLTRRVVARRLAGALKAASVA
jgi:hypothetical protein